ncbi:YicC family protein [Marinihelvus fidelis]|uniref:YicC family protein n=1 Tax=Marinihelvus fidelis TaxID=2613842 RepID=A0A5N0TAV3_9GAMM|nr:YicC/YloC family endoribonuclease [Marinihelvus fidelis]KAA9131277.1 YicC family protein [Marinihelvus fidelis]
MIRSMTGFASLERHYPFGRLSWELRSVNHRYLEFGMRLPEEFRVLEPKVRECLAKHVGRGKIDVTLRYHEAPGSSGARLELNGDMAAGLLKMHADLAASAGLDQAPDLSALMRWPGLVTEQLPDPAPLQAAALELLEEAAVKLRSAREREGAQIDGMLRERLDGIAHWTGEIRSWLPDIRDALRSRMRDRVAELAQNIDADRLEQEVAVLAQKMDVDEELDRLDAHVSETTRTLGQDDPVGRRLDFLMQEFNRESNTLSSKSVDPRTTQAAVELKVLVDQMREQVQNVE